jgi:hypothetical protein
MELPPSLHDTRLASLVRRLGGADGSGSRRLLAAGSFGTVSASALGSVVASGALEGQMRIHWTLGTGPYYGPEFAPTGLVLTLFPVLIAGTAVIAYAVDSMFRDTTAFASIRPYYVVALLGTLSVLLAFQMLLTVANL